MTRLESMRLYAESAKVNGSYCTVWCDDLLMLLDLAATSDDPILTMIFENNDLYNVKGTK